jgi:ATP-dependent Zn protease
LTCYFRHLKDVFASARINVTKANKKDVDRVIHSIVGVEYKNCSATWKEVKKRIADSEEEFVSELKKKLSLLESGQSN